MTGICSQILRIRHITLILVISASIASLHVSQYALSNVDLIAYVTGFELFIHGANPYSPVDLYVRQQELLVARSVPVMLWNPPILFIWLAPVLALPLHLVVAAATFTSFCCAMSLSWIGMRTAAFHNSKDIPLLLFTFIAFLLAPFLAEIDLVQISSWIALPVAIGTVLITLGKYPLVSGTLISLALCKPHNFYLPLLIVALQGLGERKWRVVIGGCLGFVVPAVLAELLHPGIWMAWLTREQWPTSALGANLTALIRLLYPIHDPSMVLALTCVSALLGCYVLLRFVRHCGFASKMEVLMAAWLVSPFFAPYGFLNDQVTLLLPLAYFTHRIFSEMPSARSRRFGLSVVGANIVTILANNYQLQVTQAGWFLFAPLMLVAVRSAWIARPVNTP